MIGIVAAIAGLILTAFLLYGALQFYRTITAITRGNPSIIASHDTLHLVSDNDTLMEVNASLNQQISEKLMNSTARDKIEKQFLLHRSITEFTLKMDSLQQFNITLEKSLYALKNAVNIFNMGCRSSLFNTQDVDEITLLQTFIITDENKLNSTIFECFSKKEKQCFDAIKHQALYLESIILEKNLYQLKQ